MASKAFLLDISRCIGCQACVVACKTGNELPAGTQYIHLREKTRGAFPQLTGWWDNHRCYHCADAACVAVCPTGALYKEDGLTRLTADRCSGCTYCVTTCPYGVPQVAADGHAFKCDGCATVTQAGGEPWCVKTCPSQALLYGDRAEILAEAQRRAETIKQRYPNATVYGEHEAGGLGVILVLPDTPGALDLPVNPEAPAAVRVWQQVVQPASLGLTGLSVAVTALAAVIARRNHMAEVRSLRRQTPASSAPVEKEK